MQFIPALRVLVFAVGMLACCRYAAALPVWPVATGSQNVPATIQVKAGEVYDGGMKRYYGIGSGGQNENQPAMFQLQEGSVLQNVIIGVPAGDGVHCQGSCTLKNIYWEDVGEDAATFRSTAPTNFTVDGGAAKLAADKIFQFNGNGLLTIKNFYAETGEGSWKLARSCGNCKKQYKRQFLLQNITINTDGKKPTTIVGVNSNYGDVVTFENLTILNDPAKKVPVCVRFKGNNSGKEPSVIGKGPDGVSCICPSAQLTYV